PYNVLNSQLSSYVTVYNQHVDVVGEFDDYKDSLVEGTAGSPLDSLAKTLFGKESSRPVARDAWTFATIPMEGKIGISPNCVFALLTSAAWSVGGMPIGMSIVQTPVPVLEVRSYGTACLVPC
ncbi:MAG: hypothetical protein LC623_07755, partial [Halobacteriales archaeon]|nr:hypothetical protein [Halobacteriales archaeon]